MSDFYITRMRDGVDTHWVRCSAKTLRGAKCVATRHFRDEPAGTTLMVATGDNITEFRRILCSRIVDGIAWFSLEQIH